MAATKLLILGAGATGSIVANKVSRELRREIAKDKNTFLRKDLECAVSLSIKRAREEIRDYMSVKLW